MDKLLEAFGIDWKLLIVQAVNFGILIVALWYFLYRPVLNVLQERQEKIAKGVEDAQKATQQLESADTEAKARVALADAQATEVVASAREVAGIERTRLVKEAEARASQIEKDAEARATEAQAKALRDSEKEIARLAILASAKVLGEKN
jgi:F-type H+-transporting ATPase subunit b